MLQVVCTINMNSTKEIKNQMEIKADFKNGYFNVRDPQGKIMGKIKIDQKANFKESELIVGNKKTSNCSGQMGRKNLWKRWANLPFKNKFDFREYGNNRIK